MNYLYLAKLLVKLQSHYLYLVEQIRDIEHELELAANQDDTTQRLMSIPSVGRLQQAS
jgi:transposase